MDQSRIGSLIETILNTLIGFVISFVAWPIAALLFSMEYSNAQHFQMTAFFTAISVARGYVIRRWFNGKLKRASNNIAHKITGN